MTEAEPKIDFTAIEFPSDKLTVKMLREHMPHVFDVPVEEGRRPFGGIRSGGSVGDFGSIDGTLGAVLDIERNLARNAFQRALGANLHPGDDEGLIDDYVSLGLAKGEHGAKELCRGIEAQAIDQARKYLGRSPS